MSSEKKEVPSVTVFLLCFENKSIYVVLILLAFRFERFSISNAVLSFEKERARRLDIRLERQSS